MPDASLVWRAADVRIMPPVTDPSSALGKSWRHSLRVETREQAEAAMHMQQPCTCSRPHAMHCHAHATCTCLTSCTTRYQAEAALAALGSSWDWLPGEMLRTVTKPMAALLTEARGGREVFFTAAESTFNQLADEAESTAAKAGGAATESGGGAAEVAAAPLRPLKAITYGDGAPLDAATKAALRDVAGFMERAQVAVPWQPGDALLCAAHTPPPHHPLHSSLPRHTLSPAPPRPALPRPLPMAVGPSHDAYRVRVLCATQHRQRDGAAQPRRLHAATPHPRVACGLPLQVQSGRAARGIRPRHAQGVRRCHLALLHHGPDQPC